MSLVFVGSSPGVIGERKNDPYKINIDPAVRREECLEVSVENGGLIKEALTVYS